MNEIHTWSIFGYVITFGCGVYDAVTVNLINNMLGFEFESQLTPFSAQKFIQNIIVFGCILYFQTVTT
jgi:hypothetical protein